MNRCTEWRGEHAAVTVNTVNYIDRLARYEDTGMEPEEIAGIIRAEAENGPLTRKDLLKMDGQPVWIEFIPDADGEQVKIWALVSVDPEDGEIFMLNSLGGSSAYEEVWADIRAIYRHPPEGRRRNGHGL